MDFYPTYKSDYDKETYDERQMDIGSAGMDMGSISMGSISMGSISMGSMPMGMGIMGMNMMGVSGSDLFLIPDIQRAVILEVQAFNYYQRLMVLTANQQQRQIIASIKRDEMRHFHWFSMMLRMMGAKQPAIPSGELPVNFTQGVREAIRLELEAAAFYQTIANRATAHFIRMHTMRAVYDEYRHAALLQNILVSL